MIPALASCGDNEENKPAGGSDTLAASGSASNETEPETDPVEDALVTIREEVDWGGKPFGILYANDIGGYTEEVEAEEKANDTTSSAVINNAVWERNTLFEEYGKLEFVLIPTSNSAVTTNLNAEVQSGSGDFHLVTQTTSATASVATSGILYDYLSLDIDYEKPWWDVGTLDFALAGKVFFMNGPFNIVDDDVTFIMMFNKQLREDYKVANPYDTVKANGWTLDYFNSIIAPLATENGDGKWDHLDTYGFATPDSVGNTFFYGAGLQYVRNNREMDAPELMLTGSDMERALNVLDVARSILQDGSAFVAGADAAQLSNAMNIFVEGRSLFYCEAASYLRGLNSGMETEYGVLPIPKYSTDQTHYTTWSHSIGSTLSIPTSIGKQNLEQFANVLELYAVLSEKYVRPAYYDTMLTVRNVRDAESAEMVDLIFQHRIYDMAMYFDTLGLSNAFQSSAAYENTFSSTYTAQAKNFNRKVERLLQKLNRD